MFELLEKLRAKPEKVKKQIAFIIALSVSGIIFVVWLSVIYPSWRNDQAAQERVQSLQPSPLSTFSDTFSSGLSAISNQFSKIKTVMSSFSTSPTYYNATTTATSTNQ